MLADEKTMIVTNTSVENITVNLNSDLEKANKWCDENNMVVNAEKTKAMIISTTQKQSTIQNNSLDLRIDNAAVQTFQPERLLGITIDTTLS